MSFPVAPFSQFVRELAISYHEAFVLYPAMKADEGHIKSMIEPSVFKRCPVLNFTFSTFPDGSGPLPAIGYPSAVSFNRSTVLIPQIT